MKAALMAVMAAVLFSLTACQSEDPKPTPVSGPVLVPGAAGKLRAISQGTGDIPLVFVHSLAGNGL